MSVVLRSCRLPRVYLKLARFKKKLGCGHRKNQELSMVRAQSFRYSCAGFAAGAKRDATNYLFDLRASVAGTCAIVAGMCARCAAFPVSFSCLMASRCPVQNIAREPQFL